MAVQTVTTSSVSKSNKDNDQVLPESYRQTSATLLSVDLDVSDDDPSDSDGDLTQQEQLKLLIKMMRIQGQRIKRLEESNYRLERKLGVDILDDVDDDKRDELGLTRFEREQTFRHYKKEQKKQAKFQRRYDPNSIWLTHCHAPFDVDESDDNDYSLTWLHMTMEDETFSILAFYRFAFIMTLIVISTLQYICETVPDWEDWGAWEPLEVFVSISFTVEFGIRLMACRNAFRFWRSDWYVNDTMNMIDLLAVLPFYLEIIFTAVGTNVDSSVVRVIRIIRLARLAKLSRAEEMKEVMEILGTTMLDSMSSSGPMLVALVFAELIIFSSLIFVCEKGKFYFECPQTQTLCSADDACIWKDGKCMGRFIRSDGQPTPFTSIPQTMWHVLQTITTVGYGDMAPIETWGQFVGSITMLTGVICIALVVIIIGGNFDKAFHAFKELKEKQRIQLEKERKHYFSPKGAFNINVYRQTLRSDDASAFNFIDQPGVSNNSDSDAEIISSPRFEAMVSDKNGDAKQSSKRSSKV